MPNNDDIFKYGIEIGKGLPKTVSMDVTPRQEISAEKYKEYQKAIGEQNIPFDEATLQEMAYQSQTWYSNLAKGVVRTAGKAITEILSTPGYLYGAATGLTGNGWDNAWLETFRNLDEGIKNQMPIYMSKQVEEGGILGKLTDTAYWGTTGADGLGFMVAMFAPGQALKLLGIGNKLAKGAGFLGNLAEGLSGTAVTAADLTMAGNQMSKMGRLAKTFKSASQSASFVNNAESVASVFTNTLIEASAEANNTYRNVRDELVAKNMDIKLAEDIAGNAATNVFGVNLAILGLSNSLLEKYVFKGFDPGVNVSNRLKGMPLFPEKGAAKTAVGEGVEAATEIGAKTITDIEKRSAASKAKEIAWQTLKGFTSEGWWEEGMQTSLEQYVSGQALQGNYTTFTESLLNTPMQWFNNITAMEDTKESREFYDAAVLGGILGGGMTGIATAKDVGEEDRMLFGSPEVKMRTSTLGKAMDRLTGRQPKAADPGLVAKFRGVVEASTLKHEDLLKQDENGNFVVDEEKINAVMESGRDYAKAIANMAAVEETLKKEKAAGRSTEDIEIALGNIKDRKEMLLLNQYANFEGGNEIFKEHVDAILDKMEAARVKEGDVPATPMSAVERNLEKQRLVDKVDRLSKLNKLIKDTHFSNLSFLQDEAGTETEKQNFYEANLWDKKQTGAFLDYKEEVVENLERDQKRLMADVERQKNEKGSAKFQDEQKLKELNKRLEKEKKEQEEAKTVYQRMFDNEYQKKQYNRMRELSSIQKEKIEKFEKDFEERNKETLIKDTFEEAGFDLEAQDLNLEDVAIYRTENENLKATRTDMYRDEEDFKPKTEVFKIRQGPGGFAVVRKDYDEDGNPIEEYLVGIDPMSGQLMFEKYEGLSDQVTSPTALHTFLSDVRYDYKVEEKESFEKRKREEILEEKKRILDEERDLLLNNLKEISDKHVSGMEAIQKEINDLQEQLKELDKKEKLQKLEKEKEDAEKALAELRAIFTDPAKRKVKKGDAHKQLNAEIKQIEKQIATIKNSILAQKEQLLKNQNLITEKNNRLTNIKNEYAAIQTNLDLINRYQQRIENHQEEYDKEPLTKFSEVESELLNSVIIEYFNVAADSDKAKSIKEVLSNFNTKLKDFVSSFNKKYKALREFVDDSDERIKALKSNLAKEEKAISTIEKELDKMNNAVDKINRMIERFGSIEALSPEQKAAIEKLNSEKAEKIFKSNEYAEELLKLKEGTRNIRKAIEDIQQEKKTIEQLYVIFKGIKGFQEDLYPLVQGIIDEKRRLSEQDKVELQNQVADVEPESEFESNNERIYDPANFRAYERNVLDEFTLTGKQVEFDQTPGGTPRDRRDAEGNLVFNENPQAKTWFGFTEDILLGKKKREEYTYGVYNLNNVDDGQMGALIESFGWTPGISEQDKKDALFIFVKKKDGNFLKINGNYVFAPFRKDFTNVVLTTIHKDSYLETLTEEERVNFENLDYKDKTKVIRTFMNKEYETWLNKLRNDIDAGQEVDLKMKNSNLSGGHLNLKRNSEGKVERFNLKDSLPEQIENGKIKSGVLKVHKSRGPLVIGGVSYNLSPGTVYIELQHLPVVLNQNRLSEGNIETIIALYGMLSDNFKASVGGIPVLPTVGGGQSLITTLLNNGDDIGDDGKRQSGSRIFVNRGKVKFSIGNNPLKEVSLKELKEYTELKSKKRNQEEDEKLDNLENSIKPLKDFLKTKYIYVNKNLIDTKVGIPVLKNGTIEIEKQDYNKFLLDNVLTTNLAKTGEPRFLQVNLIVDESSFKPAVEFKPREEKAKQPKEEREEPKPEKNIPVKEEEASEQTNEKIKKLRKQLKKLEDATTVYDYTMEKKQVGDQLQVEIKLNEKQVVKLTASQMDIPLMVYNAISNHLDQTYKGNIRALVNKKYFNAEDFNDFVIAFNNMRYPFTIDVTEEVNERIAEIEQELNSLVEGLFPEESEKPSEPVAPTPVTPAAVEAKEELISEAAQPENVFEKEQEKEVNEEISNVSENLVGALEDLGVQEQKPVEETETKNLGREENYDDFFNLFSDESQEDVVEEPVLPTKEEEVLPVAPTPAAVEQPGVSVAKEKEIQLTDNAKLEKITIGNESKDVAVYAKRGIVLVNINNVTVPFYLTTGRGGKNLIPGWYPYFGHFDDSNHDFYGWFNKTTGEDMIDYYSRIFDKDVASELMQIGKSLNSLYGTDSSVYEDVSDDYSKNKNKEKAFIDFINSNLSYRPTLGLMGVEKNIKELNKELKSALSVKEKENQINKIIDENVTPEEIKQVAKEEGIKEEEVKDRIKEEVVVQMNNQNIKPKSLLQKIAARIKSLLLNMLIVSTLFNATTSFMFPKNTKVYTYDKAKVENLKAFETVKLDQDEINKLGNVNAITNYRKDKPGKYIIVDKSLGLAHLYEGRNLITTYSVVVGEKAGDEQTILKSLFFNKSGEQVSANEAIYQKDGVSYLKEGYSSKTNWNEGNKKTGAGIYTVSTEGLYDGDKAFFLKNERGVSVATALHKPTNENRRRAISDKDPSNNRMSNGCLNFNTDDLNNLSERGFAKNSNIYILPDNPHNKFVIEDGELKFKSNEKDVNKTVTVYSPIPITIKAEGVNESGKIFLQTLSESKSKLMDLYPTVSNDVYNQITKIAYGIFGQESSFGTYGGIRGQVGRITDIAQLGIIKLGVEKNPSVGVTQIRFSSVNDKTRNAFKINSPGDLLNIEKSAQATMSLLLDIYVNEIPNSAKESFTESIPLIYSNQRNEVQKVFDGEKVKNSYLQNVTNYANKTSVYIGTSETALNKPTQKDKVITLDEAKSILKNLQESDQVTTKCE